MKSKLTPSSKPKSGDRRARQNKRSGRASMTRLVSTIKTQLVGRQNLLLLTTGSNGVLSGVASPLDPVSVGDRPANVAASFERFRICRMVFHFRSNLPSTSAGILAMGVHDDATNSVTTIGVNDILNFRNSVEFDCWKDQSIEYIPMDRSKWYYCNADTVNDLRFVQPAVFYIASGNALVLPTSTTGTSVTFPVFNTYEVGQVTIEYHYSFDGSSIQLD
jgi:hypothetical protein